MFSILYSNCVVSVLNISSDLIYNVLICKIKFRYFMSSLTFFLFFSAFQRYGRDFDAVAEVLESKTPDMVKAFYYEMREEIDDVSFAFLTQFSVITAYFNHVFTLKIMVN